MTPKWFRELKEFLFDPWRDFRRDEWPEVLRIVVPIVLLALAIGVGLTALGLWLG